MASVTSGPIGNISAPHQYRMGSSSVLSMTIEVRGVAGNTLAAGRMTNGAANHGTSSGVMAGLTGQVNLAAAHKRGAGRNRATGRDTGCRWRRRVGIDLHRDAVTVAMAIEVTAEMANLTGPTANRHGRGIGGRCYQAPGCGVMTGDTGVMHLVVDRIHRNTGKGTDNQRRGVAGTTIDRGDNPGQMVGNSVTHKVSTMAGITVAATGWHGRGLGGRRHQAAVSLMTSGTGVMYLVVGRINRNAGCSTNNAGRQVASIAV